MLPTCKGTVGQSFVACGEEPDLYGYCSPECEAVASIQKMSFGGNDYDFITDRLAIGNVTSRATPGFVAVVSVLATDRPGTLACEVTGAPTIPRLNDFSNQLERDLTRSRICATVIVTVLLSDYFAS